jgi:hypothetical protein
MMTLGAVLLLPVLAGADSQSTANLEVKATRLTASVTVDGILNESAWGEMVPFDRFVQRDPVERGNPSMRTEVRIGYDDAALYLAARMHDPAGDSIEVRLGRRDVEQNSDIFLFFLDPYHDRRSGVYFGLDPAGTLYDGILYNDDWDDDSWDGVWEGNVTKDAGGWTVEMRVPFAQLRFRDMDVHVWGVNFRRDIARRNESNSVVFTPKNGSGFVSRFVDLTGIHDITPPKRIEILPYVTTQAQYLQHSAGDPFRAGSRYIPRLGADFKLGLGSNLTLDATVNPDFGQVEVDPAVVNLSDVETFFNEKRPFFIEGSSTFNFGRGGVINYWGFNWSDPTLFYTRRIGRAPQGPLPRADFADAPSGTKIVGAAKLTGKIGEDWNVGSIQALTAREHADLQTAAVRSRAEVEPATYYGVVRVQKEFNEGRQSIGFMSTTTSRFFHEDRLRNELNSGSTVAGLDGWLVLDSSKSWVLNGWGVGSYVGGSASRLLAVQSNAQHYLQRPDAVHHRIDSTATSLMGYAARLVLAKQRGNSFFNSALGVINPNFDNNDLGFLWRADVINLHAAGGYQWVVPTDWYRRIELGLAFFRSYDFDRNITWEGVYNYAKVEWPNYYTLRLDWAYNPETVNSRRTRGGPLSLNAPGYQIDWEVISDTRKSVSFDIWSFLYQDLQTSWSLSALVEFHPSRNLTVSLGPGFERNVDYAWWVGSFADPTATATFGSRYVFALFQQNSVSANIRLNWSFTPQLSLQLFIQPLISAADYRDFLELRRPRSRDFLTYGREGSAITAANGSYTVDPDGPGPAAAFSFSDPNFKFISLRGNAVLRWEYLPGSALYVVWTQTRAHSEVSGDFQFRNALRQMVDIRPDNIFMVKLSYWWSR